MIGGVDPRDIHQIRAELTMLQAELRGLRSTLLEQEAAISELKEMIDAVKAERADP